MVISIFLGANAGDQVNIDSTTSLGKKKPEDNIPVIEIRGEGKPMTSAQIRAVSFSDLLTFFLQK